MEPLEEQMKAFGYISTLMEFPASAGAFVVLRWASCVKTKRPNPFAPAQSELHAALQDICAPLYAIRSTLSKAISNAEE